SERRMRRRNIGAPGSGTTVEYTVHAPKSRRDSQIIAGCREGMAQVGTESPPSRSDGGFRMWDRGASTPGSRPRPQTGAEELPGRGARRLLGQKLMQFLRKKNQWHTSEIRGHTPRNKRSCLSRSTLSPSRAPTCASFTPSTAYFI